MRAEVVPGCGACGRHEVCGVWLVRSQRREGGARPAGPGRASRRRAERSSWRGRRAGGCPRAMVWLKWVGCGGWRAARGLRGLVVVPVGGGGAWPGFEIDHSERSSCVAISRAGRRPQAQPAGSSGQASRRPEVWWRRCRAGARWRRCRAKLVARTASGRVGLAPPGSVVVELPPGSEVAEVPPGSVVAKLPRGSEVGRSSASGGVEVEEGD